LTGVGEVADLERTALVFLKRPRLAGILPNSCTLSCISRTIETNAKHKGVSASAETETP
jgi:hypothetical protein